ncbi:MAG: glycoside hydrolase, partial [Clostridiales bacterium]|nr:glycoside hydrolase [Clostridiales bacterium]
DGWPIIGENGTTPLELTLVASDAVPNNNIVSNDEFDYDENKLLLSWQWNHNPDNSMWSLTDRPGYLRLTNGHVARNIFSAKNTLTQRTLGPSFTSEVKLHTSGMKSGDYAGIAAFQSTYGLLGVKVGEDDSIKYLILGTNDGEGDIKEEFSLPLTQDDIYLKIEYIFNTGTPKKLNVVDKAYFYYSLDGAQWTKIDYTLSMAYTLDHFVGYRTALFSYATLETGGYSDFDYYRYTVGELVK